MLEIKTGDAIVRSCVTQVTKANLITFMDPVYLDFIPNQWLMGKCYLNKQTKKRWIITTANTKQYLYFLPSLYH